MPVSCMRRASYHEVSIIPQYLPTNCIPKEDKTATNPKYTAYIFLAIREFDAACTDSPESLVIVFFPASVRDTDSP